MIPTFNFTISPVGVAQIHEALSCLARFDENISLEANSQGIRISSLNSSKTAYASFIFKAGEFFEKYHFSVFTRSSESGEKQPTWACKIQNRALLSIFKRRQADNKERETSIERCEFELQASAEQPECRLTFRLYCRFSVVKTYRLTYESTEVLHATFDQQGSKNSWTIPARTLRDVVEYFGPKTEHVDWSLSDGKVIFTSYSDKIQVGKGKTLHRLVMIEANNASTEIIRQPTHTSVTLDERDFEDCKIEPNHHISIPAKDFRSIVAHADTVKASIKTAYSRGHRPLQMTYGTGGLVAEFTLMTKGTSSTVTDSSRASTAARGLSVRRTTQPANASRAASEARSEMPPPNAPPTRTTLPNRQARSDPERPENAPTKQATPTSTSMETPVPSASINQDSMFFPSADDDQQWEPPNFEEDDGIVTWDNEVTSAFDASTASRRKDRDASTETPATHSGATGSGVMQIDPTQRLSQIKGMFD